MVSSEVLLLITSILFVGALPWIAKNSDNWNKIKKWYPLLLSGLLVGIGAVGLRVFALAETPLISKIYFYIYFELIFEFVGSVLGAISLFGMVKELVLNR
jgi:hypothetical protein